MVHEASTSTWKGARRIRDILLEKKLTWKELQQETTLSHNILSRYLRDLQKDGEIFKGQIDGKYSSYERADQSFAHQLDESIVVSDQILFVKDFLERKQVRTRKPSWLKPFEPARCY
jgi:hypothetical protein